MPKKTPQQIAEELRKIGEAASSRAQKMRVVGTIVERSMDKYPYFLPQFEGLTDAEVDELWKTRPWVMDVLNPYARYNGDGSYGKGWLSGIKNLPPAGKFKRFYYDHTDFMGSKILTPDINVNSTGGEVQIFTRALIERLNNTTLPMTPAEKQVVYNFMDNSKRAVFFNIAQYAKDTLEGKEIFSPYGVNNWRAFRDDYAKKHNINPFTYKEWGFQNDTDYPVAQVIADNGIYNGQPRSGIGNRFDWIEPRLSKWYKEGSFDPKTYTFNLSNFYIKNLGNDVDRSEVSTTQPLLGAMANWHSFSFENIPNWYPGTKWSRSRLNLFRNHTNIIEQTQKSIDRYNAARLKVGDHKSVINSDLSAVQFLRQRTASAFSDPSLFSKLKDVFVPETNPHDNVIENTREYQNNQKEFQELVTLDNALKAVELSDEDFKTVVGVPSGSDVEEGDKQQLAVKLNELAGAKAEEFFNKYSLKFLGLDPKDAQLARNELRMANLKEIVPYTLKLGLPAPNPELHIWSKDTQLPIPEELGGGNKTSGIGWVVSKPKDPLEVEFNVLFIPKDLKHSGGKNVEVVEKKDNKGGKKLVTTFKKDVLQPQALTVDKDDVNRNIASLYKNEIMEKLGVGEKEVSLYVDEILDDADMSRTIFGDALANNLNRSLFIAGNTSGISQGKPEVNKTIVQNVKNNTRFDDLLSAFDAKINNKKKEFLIDLAEISRIKTVFSLDKNKIANIQRIRRNNLLQLGTLRETNKSEYEKTKKNIDELNKDLTTLMQNRQNNFILLTSKYENAVQQQDKIVGIMMGKRSFIDNVTFKLKKQIIDNNVSEDERNAVREQLKNRTFSDKDDFDKAVYNNIWRSSKFQKLARKNFYGAFYRVDNVEKKDVAVDYKDKELNQILEFLTKNGYTSRSDDVYQISKNVETSSSKVDLNQSYPRPEVRRKQALQALQEANTTTVDLNQSYPQPKDRLLQTVKPSSANDNAFSIDREYEAGKAETGAGAGKKIIVKKEKTKMPGDRLGITNIVLGSSFLSGARALLLPNGSLFKMKN